MGKKNEVMFDKPFLKVIQTQRFYFNFIFTVSRILFSIQYKIKILKMSNE